MNKELLFILVYMCVLQGVAVELGNHLGVRVHSICGGRGTQVEMHVFSSQNEPADSLILLV